MTNDIISGSLWEVTKEHRYNYQDERKSSVFLKPGDIIMVIEHRPSTVVQDTEDVTILFGEQIHEFKRVNFEQWPKYYKRAYA